MRLLICCVENAIVIDEDGHELEPQEDADDEVSDAAEQYSMDVDAITEELRGRIDEMIVKLG